MSAHVIPLEESKGQMLPSPIKNPGPFELLYQIEGVLDQLDGEAGKIYADDDGVPQLRKEIRALLKSTGRPKRRA